MNNDSIAKLSAALVAADTLAAAVKGTHLLSSSTRTERDAADDRVDLALVDYFEARQALVAIGLAK